MKETELSVFKTDHLILSTDSLVFKIGPREEDIERSVFSSRSSVLKNERIVSFTGLSEKNTEPSFLKEERCSGAMWEYGKERQPMKFEEE